jgi:hypothetical protein
MKSYQLLLWLFLPMLIITSCKGSDEPEDKTIQRTVLVYMMADNSLGSQGLDASDLAEMVAGMANVDITKNNLLIYWDPSSTSPQLIKLEKKNKTIVKTIVQSYSEQVSTSEDVMKSVFSYVFTNYPAQSYGLVLWSHALGWAVESTRALSTITRYAGIDDTGGTYYLNTSTIVNALSSSAPHLDFILFDECYMASVEALYDLRSYADYFIASAEEIPGPGAYYTDVVPAMFTSSNVGKTITEAYYNYYGNLYKQDAVNYGNPWIGGASISLIKSSMLDNLAAATKTIIPTYMQNKAEVDVSNFFCYDLYNNGTHKIFFDFDSFMKYITNGDANYTAWKTAYDQCVVEYKTTATNYTFFNSASPINMTGSTGLSIYVPTSRGLTRSDGTGTLRNSDFQNTAWYSAAGWDKTGW